MKKLIVSTMFITLFSVTANAGGFVEPYLGYMAGSFDDSSDSADLKGLAYGARGGYMNGGFMIGAEYFGSNFSGDDGGGDLKASDIGVVVGYDMGFRVYGTYSVIHKWALSGGGVSIDLEGGSQFKIGVGYTFAKTVAVNLEYLSASFDEMAGISLPAEMKATMYGLTVSLPLSF